MLTMVTLVTSDEKIISHRMSGRITPIMVQRLPLANLTSILISIGPPMSARSRLLLAHGAAYLLGQCSQCLAGGSAAALKRAVVGVERRQHEGMLLSVGLDVHEPSLTKERLCFAASPSAKVRVVASARLGTYRATTLLIRPL